MAHPIGNYETYCSLWQNWEAQRTANQCCFELLCQQPETLGDELPHTQPINKDSVRGTGIPHVLDLWCDDQTHGTESFCNDSMGGPWQELEVQRTAHQCRFDSLCPLTGITGAAPQPAEAVPDGDLETPEVVPVDPIATSTVESSQRPLPFAFASASDDALLDEIILGHPHAHQLLTVRTFGYKRRHLGQRMLKIKAAELPHWRHRVQELWTDHDEAPLQIFPIRPPPYLEPHTISVIVQLGEGTANEVVVLTQMVHDEAHSLEPTEPIVHSIPHTVTKTGLCLKLNIHPALHSSAVVKQGHSVWLTGFSKTLSNGAYLRVVIDTPSDEAVSLLQESAPATLCQPQLLGPGTPDRESPAQMTSTRRHPDYFRLTLAGQTAYSPGIFGKSSSTTWKVTTSDSCSMDWQSNPSKPGGEAHKSCRGEQFSSLPEHSSMK